MDSITATRIIYFISWCAVTILYWCFSAKQRKNYNQWKNDWNEIREKSVRLVRHIDLTEQYGMLLELHEIQEDYPNVSRHDTAMMNTINYYIENTARQLRYLDNKNEPSENGDNGTDNSN